MDCEVGLHSKRQTAPGLSLNAALRKNLLDSLILLGFGEMRAL